jgi:MFS family permease
MSARDPYPAPAAADSPGSSLVRAAIWVAIGALIAAAIVCVIWVLIGTQNGIIGRAFLTILLLAAFAGVAIIDAQLAPRRPAWFALASMVTWVITLLIGAVMIWMPERYSWSGFNRFVQFLLIVLILQLALLHIRLYTKAFFRHVTTFTQIVAIVTITLVIGLAIMLVLPLMFGEWVDFGDLYWRFIVAITILAAVGTALIPLVNALFAPKKPRPAHLNAPPIAQGPMVTAALPPWPTYADGVTPLPMMPDGSPDWNAYYTGYPSNISQAIAPVAPFAPPSAPPQQPTVPRGYEGFPPPPPLPPRP